MTLIGVPIQGLLEPTNLAMLYLAGVIIAAVFLGRGPSILASLVSVLAFDFFFIDPAFSFDVSDTQYIVTFVGLLLVGLVISNSAALLRGQVDVLRRREGQAQALYALSRELTAAASLEQVLSAVVPHLSETFSRDVVVLLPDGSRLAPRAATPGFTLDDNELAVAEWSFRHGQPAGRGTDTLPAASIRYVPLSTARGTVGVLGVRPSDAQSLLTPDQRMLLEGFANLSALAIERASLAQRA
jgi:two-component system sensor histidine kinase KdpD